MLCNHSVSRKLLGAALAALSLLFLNAGTAAGTPGRNAAPVVVRATAAQAPQGLGPMQIRSLYSLPAHGTPGQTIAIVSVYDDPHVEGDLAAYSKRFGLPACTRKNGCLRKVNEFGTASPLPSADFTGGTWITESSLGVEVAHGVCQSCRIVLVEANNITPDDIAQSVKTAAALGATVIGTAFTAPEVESFSGFIDAFNQAKAPVLAAAGDTGYSRTPNFPAVLPDVVAVGGTQVLYDRRGRPRGERAWSGTTSGCSQNLAAPAWQSQLASAAGCGSYRAVADVAAVSDPGAIIYISGMDQNGGPWFVASGTSLSVPVLAGVIGLAGSAGSGEAKMLYSRALADPGVLRDIRSGSDTFGCMSRMCQAGPGWDGPTGLGTPRGLEAFLPGGARLSPKHPDLRIAVPRGGLRVGSRWQVRLPLVNGNAFRVGGTLILRLRVRVSRRLGTTVLASIPVRIGPLGSANPLLVIAPRYRATLKRLGSESAYAELDAKAPAGPTVRVLARLRLQAP